MVKKEDKYSDESRRLEIAQEFCQRRVLDKQSEMVAFLEDVALNPEFKDNRVVKDKDGDFLVKKVPASAVLRLSAAKLWKEMVADKAIGDVKEKARQKQQGGGIDMRAAIEALAKQAKIEDKKAEDGDEEEVEL